MEHDDFLNDIETLTDTEKDSIRLRFCQDLSFTEMGKQLGISTRAAQLVLLQALNKVWTAIGPKPGFAA